MAKPYKLDAYEEREGMGDDMFESAHDRAVNDLLDTLETACYSQLVNKVSSGRSVDLTDARKICWVLKAVGLI